MDQKPPRASRDDVVVSIEKQSDAYCYPLRQADEIKLGENGPCHKTITGATRQDIFTRTVSTIIWWGDTSTRSVRIRHEGGRHYRRTVAAGDKHNHTCKLSNGARPSRTLAIRADASAWRKNQRRSLI